MCSSNSWAWKSFHVCAFSSVFSSVFYSFQSAGRYLDAVDSSVLCFWCNCKWGCFLNFSFSTSLLVHRNATDFCILILCPEIYWIHISVPEAFRWSLSGFSCRASYCLPRMKVSLPFSNLYGFIYFFVVWLLWIGLAVLCWIVVVRADIGWIILTSC